MMNDTLRALAGILASKELDDEIKDRAKVLIFKILDMIDRDLSMQNKMMNKASAEMNGIIS